MIDKKECKAVISELISSAHDVAQISQHYLKMRLDFEKIYPNKSFSFRLIVTDWSRATIHSLIEQFNRLFIYQYADMMFEFSKGKNELKLFCFDFKVAKYTSKSLIIMCASHNMKNVTCDLIHV